MKLSEKLQILRQQHGYNQQDLAVILGIEAQLINDWEKDISMPSVDSLKRISKLYSVSLDDLLDDDKDINGKKPIIEQAKMDEPSIKIDKSLSKKKRIEKIPFLISSILSLCLYVPFFIAVMAVMLEYFPSNSSHSSLDSANIFAYFFSLATYIILVIGLIVALVKSINSVRFPVSYQHSNAPTLCSIIGFAALATLDFAGLGNVGYPFSILFFISILLNLLSCFFQEQSSSSKDILIDSLSFMLVLSLLLLNHHGLIFFTNIYNIGIMFLSTLVIASFGISIGMLVNRKIKFVSIPVAISVISYLVMNLSFNQYWSSDYFRYYGNRIVIYIVFSFIFSIALLVLYLLKKNGVLEKLKHNDKRTTKSFGILTLIGTLVIGIGIFTFIVGINAGDNLSYLSNNLGTSYLFAAFIPFFLMLSVFVIFAPATVFESSLILSKKQEGKTMFSKIILISSLVFICIMFACQNNIRYTYQHCYPIYITFIGFLILVLGISINYFFEKEHNIIYKLSTIIFYISIVLLPLFMQFPYSDGKYSHGMFYGVSYNNQNVTSPILIAVAWTLLAVCLALMLFRKRGIASIGSCLYMLFMIIALLSQINSMKSQCGLSIMGVLLVIVSSIIVVSSISISILSIVERKHNKSATNNC